MADAQVSCVNKIARNNRHDGITHLGEPNCRWTGQHAIESFKANSNTFYMSVGGTRANVAPAYSACRGREQPEQGRRDCGG